MSILTAWRGTGRRRLPDALDRAREENRALERRLLVAEAANRTYQDEQAEYQARIRDLTDTLTWQGLGLEEARAEAAELAAQLAVLRRDLAASREALQRADGEIRLLEEDRTDLIGTQHRLAADRQRLRREVAGAQETQALDVSALRAETGAPVPLDADDTVTLPVPATPPAPVVHPVGEVLPIPPGSEDTRPLVTVGTLADIAGGAA